MRSCRSLFISWLALALCTGCGDGAVTGGDDPSARAPMTTEASCTCGTQIDGPLDDVLSGLSQFFDSRAAATDSTRRNQVVGACSALLTEDGWDVFPLAFAETRALDQDNLIIDLDAKCGTEGQCRGSVTLSNRCFFAGAVNYVLYGSAMHHCSEVLRGYGMTPAVQRTFKDICGELAYANGYEKICDAIHQTINTLASRLSSYCLQRFGASNPVDKACSAASDKLRQLEDLGVSLGYDNYLLPIYLWRLTKISPEDNNYSTFEQDIPKLISFLGELLTNRVAAADVPSFLKPAVDRAAWAALGWRSTSSSGGLRTLDGIGSGMGGELLSTQAASCSTRSTTSLPWHVGGGFCGSQ